MALLTEVAKTVEKVTPNITPKKGKGSMKNTLGTLAMFFALMIAYDTVVKPWFDRTLRPKIESLL